MREGTPSELQEFVESVAGKQLLLSKILDIVGNFDFEKVQRVMEQEGWCWGRFIDSDGVEQTNKVPDEDVLRVKAFELLLDAVKVGGTVATGGFVASVGYFPDEPEYLYKLPVSLKFVLEEVES